MTNLRPCCVPSRSDESPENRPAPVIQPRESAERGRVVELGGGPFAMGNHLDDGYPADGETPVLAERGSQGNAGESDAGSPRGVGVVGRFILRARRGPPCSGASRRPACAGGACRACLDPPSARRLTEGVGTRGVPS